MIKGALLALLLLHLLPGSSPRNDLHVHESNSLWQDQWVGSPKETLELFLKLKFCEKDFANS